MSTDDWDARQDDYILSVLDELGPEWAADHWPELFREHYEEAADGFAADRLISYYIRHPDVAGPAFRQFEKARSLSSVDAEASLVFCTSAVEIALMSALFKPLLYGLVHTEAAAGLVLALVPYSAGVDHFRDVLFRLLADFGGIDLRTFKRQGAAQTLWEEIKAVRTVRNRVVHGGELVTSAYSELSQVLAAEVLSHVLPTVLTKLGLSLRGTTICRCSDSSGMLPFEE